MRDIKQNIVTAFALGIMASAGLGMGYIIKEEPQNNTIKQSSAPIPQVVNQNFPAAPKIPKYIMKVHDGKLAVFMGNKTQPELVFDQYIHLLPDIDRKELEKGIEVEDYQQLLKLIEDYTS